MSSVNAANKETVTLADESALPQQPTLSPALSPTTTATEPPASPETLDDLRHDDAIIITEPSSNGRSSDPEKMLDSAMDGDLPPDPIDPGNEPLILMNTVDGTLQGSLRSALTGVLNFIASFLVIILVVPSFAPFAVVIAWLYIRLAPPYVSASRDLRRLESISLSPAFAGFDELLRGLPHVRAFAMESRYQDRFYQRVDKFQSFDHVYVGTLPANLDATAQAHN